MRFVSETLATDRVDSCIKAYQICHREIIKDEAELLKA